MIIGVGMLKAVNLTWRLGVEGVMVMRKLGSWVTKRPTPNRFGLLRRSWCASLLIVGMVEEVFHMCHPLL